MTYSYPTVRTAAPQHTITINPLNIHNCIRKLKMNNKNDLTRDIAIAAHNMQTHTAHTKHNSMLRFLPGMARVLCVCVCAMSSYFIELLPLTMAT